MTSHIPHQVPSKITGSKNMITTNFSLVKCLCLKIMKGSRYILGEGYSTRGGNMIPVVF